MHHMPSSMCILLAVFAIAEKNIQFCRMPGDDNVRLWSNRMRPKCRLCCQTVWGLMLC